MVSVEEVAGNPNNKFDIKEHMDLKERYLPEFNDGCIEKYRFLIFDRNNNHV